MRVAIVTESFAPDVNGVANSVLRVAEHLHASGHDPLVIAPAPATGRTRVPDPLPYPVLRVPSIGLPGYPSFRIGLPSLARGMSARVLEAVREHRADVVHLASPFVLGAWGATIAMSLDLPALAVYQTDIPGYARAYGMGLSERAAWRWIRRVHGRAARTLAPSSATAADLLTHGVRDVWLWRRGIDLGRFQAAQRSDAVRRALAPNGEVIVGYVGRLAVEKRLDLLAETSRLPGVRLVLVGDGPAGPALRKELPGALFLGERHGAQLARLHASFDVFVHTGPHETFGQAVQEAMASGVPVVAPAAGGPIDLVLPGRTGTLVPPYNGAAVAAAVAELVADPDRRARYGQAASLAVQGRTWAAVGDELIGHYRAVLGAPDLAPTMDSPEPEPEPVIAPAEVSPDPRPVSVP